MTSIDFQVRPFEDDNDCHVVTPVVAGVVLVGLVEEFERRQLFEPSGGYGGLIPEWFRFGSALTHFLAADGAYLDEGRVPLLGCTCGEWGCWPLLVRITLDDEKVTWSDFRQPHRPDRDYSGFGPFVFKRRDYFDAIGAISGVWISEGRSPRALG